MILWLIGMSWVALLGVAMLPAAFAPACLLLNGLPLGMIWGLVVSYLGGGAGGTAFLGTPRTVTAALTFDF